MTPFFKNHRAFNQVQAFECSEKSGVSRHSRSPRIGRKMGWVLLASALWMPASVSWGMEVAHKVQKFREALPYDEIGRIQILNQILEGQKLSPVQFQAAMDALDQEIQSAANGGFLGELKKRSTAPADAKGPRYIVPSFLEKQKTAADWLKRQTPTSEDILEYKKRLQTPMKLHSPNILHKMQQEYEDQYLLGPDYQLVREECLQVVSGNPLARGVPRDGQLPVVKKPFRQEFNEKETREALQFHGRILRLQEQGQECWNPARNQQSQATALFNASQRYVELQLQYVHRCGCIPRPSMNTIQQMISHCTAPPNKGKDGTTDLLSYRTALETALQGMEPDNSLNCLQIFDDLPKLKKQCDLAFMGCEKIKAVYIQSSEQPPSPPEPPVCPVPAAPRVAGVSGFIQPVKPLIGRSPVHFGGGENPPDDPVPPVPPGSLVTPPTDSDDDDSRSKPSVMDPPRGPNAPVAPPLPLLEEEEEDPVQPKPPKPNPENGPGGIPPKSSNDEPKLMPIPERENGDNPFRDDPEFAIVSTGPAQTLSVARMRKQQPKKDRLAEVRASRSALPPTAPPPPPSGSNPAAPPDDSAAPPAAPPVAGPPPVPPRDLVDEEDENPNDAAAAKKKGKKKKDKGKGRDDKEQEELSPPVQPAVGRHLDPKSMLVVPKPDAVVPAAAPKKETGKSVWQRTQGLRESVRKKLSRGTKTVPVDGSSDDSPGPISGAKNPPALRGMGLGSSARLPRPAAQADWRSSSMGGPGKPKEIEEPMESDSRLQPRQQGLAPSEGWR